MTILGLIASSIFAQAPLPGSKRPLNIISSQCSGSTGGRSRGLYELDASLDLSGITYLLHEGQQWSNAARPFQLAPGRSVPSGASGASFLATPVKFRQGTFWRRDGQRLQTLVPGRGWTTALETDRPFQDFEVTHQGSLVLVGTESHLLAFYELRGEAPVAQVDYPDLGVSGPRAAELDFYWTRVKTTAVDQTLLIYFAGCGRLFLFNVPDRSLKEVDTPWAPFDAKDTAKIIREGAANLSGHPSLWCIQFIPSTFGSVRIAYQCPKVEATLRYAADGRVESFSTKRLPSASDVLQSFDLDPQSGAKGAGSTHPDLKFPVWIGAQGDLVPLASVLAGEPKPATPAR